MGSVGSTNSIITATDVQGARITIKTSVNPKEISAAQSIIKQYKIQQARLTGSKDDVNKMGSVGTINWMPVRKSRNYNIALEMASISSSGEYGADYRYRPVGGGDWYIDRVYMMGGRGTQAYDRVESDGSRTLYSDLSGAVNRDYSREIEQRRNRIERRSRR